MNLITVDFETYYDRYFSLSRITTEEYIRDERFEVIGVGVKVNDEKTEWFSDNKEETAKFLKKFNWEESFVLAHNMMFDGAILSWIFDIHPKVLVDTLSMARPVHGVDAAASLKALAEYYNLGAKGTEVVNAMGKRRFMFDSDDLWLYGEYCRNDVDLTYKLFQILKEGFPVKELKLIDLTLKMFTEPVLKIDIPLLEQNLKDVLGRKDYLLARAESNREVIMSNEKFAQALQELGVDPPTKISPRTGKRTWAFSKTDEEFKDLMETAPEEAQYLIAARLGVKTTIEETRTQRFIDIGKRGPLPVPLKYYAAHTGRWGGADKVNLQNLPARDGKSAIKHSIIAPEGFSLVDADSSQIEARTLAWLAGQDDLVEAFAKGEDVYKIMASAIYRKPIEEITKEERFVGKTTILGAGYGMGSVKFQAQLKAFGVDIGQDEAARIIKVYRNTYPRIQDLWQHGKEALRVMLLSTLKEAAFDRRGALKVVKKGFLLPNGLKLTYNNLRKENEVSNGENREVFRYDSRREKGIYLYGGKVVENVVQALARCIVGEQMLLVAKKYRVVLTVHDAVMCVVRDEEVEEARAYVEQCMRTVPTWAEGLPVNCESGSGKSYGSC